MTAPTVQSGVTTDDTGRSGTTYTMNLPASIGAGDTLIAFLSSEYGTGGAFSPGGSWTVLYDIQVFASGLDNPITALCCYKKATGSEGATEAITIQNAATYAVCYRVTGAADPTVTPPEYVFKTYGSVTQPYCDPILPSAQKYDDYVQFRAHHTTRNFSYGYPLPDSQYQVGGDCRVGACSDQLTGFSFEDGGYFSGFTTFWAAGTSRVVIYPSTSYTHPSDNFPHVQTVAASDETNLSGSTLALQLPAGIASGDILLAIMTIDAPAASSSDGITWPAGWTELYTREQVNGNFVGSAAYRVATGSEGSSVNMTVGAGAEIAALVYRFDQADGTRVDYEFHEASASFDSVRYDALKPAGGQDNFIFVAGIHLPNQPRCTNVSANYNSYGRIDSAGGNASLRFSHRALNASTETPPSQDLSTEGDYLSVVFAVMSNTQTGSEKRVTQAVGQVLYEQGGIDARVTQITAGVLAYADTDARFSQLVGQALVTATPCDMHRSQLWKITRLDGTVYRYTTHDIALTMAGETYNPCNSLKSTASSAGILNQQGAGDIEIGGLISATEITERDLANGLFDGATVEVWRVPTNDPTYATDSRQRILYGVLGTTRQNGTSYTAELQNHSVKLGQLPLLDTFTPACRFKPGDGKCPISIAGATSYGKVRLAADRIAIYRQSFRQFVTGLGDPCGSGQTSYPSGSDPLAGQVEGGRLTWLTGNNVGIQSEVKDAYVYDSATGCIAVTLWAAMPFEIAVGDEFKIEPGCNRSVQDHTVKFGLDMDSFGGFPDVPGSDAIIRGPDR